MLDVNFWQNKNNSKNLIKEKKLYEELVNSYNSSVNKFKDLNELNELAIEENDQSVKNEVIKSILNLKNDMLGKMLIFNSLSSDFRKVKLTKNNKCINICKKRFK